MRFSERETQTTCISRVFEEDFGGFPSGRERSDFPQRVDAKLVDHRVDVIGPSASRLPCRALLVDDSAVFLEAVDRLVTSLPGVRVIGAATSGAEALEKAATLHPDMVLIDCAMPWMDGLQVARCLIARPWPPRIVLMTADDDDAYHRAAKAAGAEACLKKSDLSETLGGLIEYLFPDGGTAEHAGVVLS